MALFFGLLPIGAGQAGAQEGSALRQLVLGVLFVAGAFAIARHPERWERIGRAVPWALFALVGYVLLSAVWSPEPWVSFKRGAQVAGVVVLGLGLTLGGDGRYRLYKVLTPIVLIGTLLAIFVSTLYPEFAFADNGLRGFMFTKNNFGQFCVIGIAVALAWMLIERRYIVWAGVLLVLCLVGLALSRSLTAILALGILAFLATLPLGVRMLRSSWLPVVLTLLLGSIAIGFFAGVFLGFPSPVVVLETVLEPTGKDLTLTGRTYLWELMWAEAIRHPWFGLGYGSFWLGMEGRSGQVAFLVGWGYPGQAHNGYLDIFNELGVVGIGLTAILLIQHLRNLSQLAASNARLAYFHFAVLGFVVVLNLAEAVMLRTTSTWWMLLVASIIEVGWLTAKGPVGGNKKLNPS